MECKFSPFEVKFDGGDAGTFSGYGAVFANVDLGGDMIKQGAFTKSLVQSMPKMFVNHAGMAFGTTSATDMIPIGVWTKASEDSHGLAMEGRLIGLDTERGKQIYGAMREGALDCLSIGYKALNFTRGAAATDPNRTILEAKLFEVSPVAMPMNPEARITQVKSNADPKNIRYLEDVLCDAGLSRRESKAILAEGFKSLLRDAGEDPELAALLRRAASIITPVNKEPSYG